MQVSFKARDPSSSFAGYVNALRSKDIRISFKARDPSPSFEGYVNSLRSKDIRVPFVCIVPISRVLDSTTIGYQPWLSTQNVVSLSTIIKLCDFCLFFYYSTHVYGELSNT